MSSDSTDIEVQTETNAQGSLSRDDLAALVRQYHQLSKHRFDGYAKGPETIDWDSQPDPFRRFAGAPVIELPLLQDCQRDEVINRLRTLDFNALFVPQHSEAESAATKYSLQTLGFMLEYSLALSAWKQYGGARWSLRCNPSSGNLHPTEAYLITRGVENLADGVYHYRADLHALELRCAFAETSGVDTPQVFVGLSSVPWREAWKYGERAYRYCQLDTGHALAGIAIGANLLGWSLESQSLPDHELTQLLGTSRQTDFVAGEEEYADCLLQLQCGDHRDKSSESTAAANQQVLQSLCAAAASGEWYGKAEVLDRHHFYQWPVIDELTQALQHPPTSEAANPLSSTAESANTDFPAALQGDYREPLSFLIRQRRSAQAFDGYTSISREKFFVILDHLLPRVTIAPWSLLPSSPGIHCVIFVHRVEGITPGLYAFARSESGEALLRQQLREQFSWQKVAEAPEHLPFYELIHAKAERTAAKLSCQQGIAGDSAFSLSMLAEFAGTIDTQPQRYRELYWEAGALGQQLYLEAEGIGLQGTGIGCFFDDPVHELFGIQGDALQSVYHFTLGGALHDSRIVSFPPYADRQR